MPLCVKAVVSKSLPVPLLLDTDNAEPHQLFGGESLTHTSVVMVGNLYSGCVTTTGECCHT